MLVYSFEANAYKLTHTYSHLLKNNGKDTVIYDLLYSGQLGTVFAVCEKSIVLLNSTNLNQYDRIVDKRGIQQAWVLEKLTKSNYTITALLYHPKKAASLKLFLWKDRTFTTVLEIALGSKDERVTSIEIDHIGFLIASNLAVYYWRLSDMTTQKIDKIVSPLWPQNIHDALKEMETYRLKPNKIHEKPSSSSESVLSHKGSRRFFFPMRGATGTIQNERLIFQPDNRQKHAIMMDGKQKKIFTISVHDRAAPHMSMRDGNNFFESNESFDHMQYLSSRFLLLNNRDYVRIVDYQYGFAYLDLFVEEGIKIVKKAQDSSLLVWTCADTLRVYKILISDESDAMSDEATFPEIEKFDMSHSMKKIAFCKAILCPHSRLALCESSECEDINDLLDLYALKLRDLNVLWSLNCFEHCQSFFGMAPKDPKRLIRFSKLQEFVIKGIFDNFIKFLAPPELVIYHCFPGFVSKLVNDATLNEFKPISEEFINEIPPQYINRWCMPYLTDIRRNLYNLSEKKTIMWTLQDRKIEVTVQFFQINHLQELDVPTLLKIVDTAIFNFYLKFNPSMLGPFTRVNNYCDFDTVEQELSKNQRIQELVDFYYQRNKHEKALQLLTGLESHVKSSSPDEIAEKVKALVIDYLIKLPQKESSVLFQYSGWLLERFPGDKSTIISSVFMNFSPNCSKLNFMEVYEFINSIDKAIALTYLEFVADSFRTTQRGVYMELIRRYLQNISDSRNARKLEAVLRWGDSYDPRTVLRYLDEAIEADTPGTVFKLVKRLKVYPLKIMGEHDQSLSILFEDLSDYSFASAYCNDVYQKDAQTGLELFGNLFERLVKKYSNGENGFRNLLQFLKDFSTRLDSIEILRKLPSNIKIADLNQVFAKKIEASFVEQEKYIPDGTELTTGSISGEDVQP